MQNIKLSHKLIGGFIAVAIISLIVGLCGWYSTQKLSRHLKQMGEVDLPAVQALLTLEKSLEQIKVVTRTMLDQELDQKGRERQLANMEKIRRGYENDWEIYTKLTKTEEEEQLWDEFKTLWREVIIAHDSIFSIVKEIDTLDIINPEALHAKIEGFKFDHYHLMAEALMMDSDHLIAGGEDHHACAYGQWIADFQTSNPALQAIVEATKRPHHNFHATLAEAKQAAKKGADEDVERIIQKKMRPAAEELFDGFEKINQQVNKTRILYDKMSRLTMLEIRGKYEAVSSLLDQLVQMVGERKSKNQKEITSVVALGNKIIFACTAAGFLFALAVGLLLSTSISKTLHRIIEGLHGSSEQVASASVQASSAGQVLAEGSSEQAAAIEETSASLEEMSSMTRQNADNAGQADSLMKEIRLVVDKANVSMTELNTSMQAISNASEETSKIIKTIDEIAFQTNLLALNAAVEAARAGAAGAGFSVVADEVRNLAMRAAEAAKSTAGLIEGTIQKVEEGGKLMAATNQTFEEVAVNSTKAAELVAEIAAASSEQAQGIGQVNTAVSEMDKVVQQNAASAEESASASEAMSTQARRMKDYVYDLVSLVGASKSGDGRIEKKEDHCNGEVYGQHGSGLPPKRKPSIHRAGLAESASKRKVVPEQIIPLDREGDFVDF